MTEQAPLDEVFSDTDNFREKQKHKCFMNQNLEVQKDHCESLDVFVPYLNKHKNVVENVR
jgi:hypothetical protein